MSEPADEYDSPWKEALEKYFPAFLSLLFPEAFAGIDWSRGYEFLDKELQQVVRDSETHRREADKLVRVWRIDGQEAWVLVHVEVQGQVERGFEERMWIYHYRIFDRFRRVVVSLAVLADTSANWRPQSYGHELWGCRLQLDFPTAKLLDLAEGREELQQSDNPMAVVILAHLDAQATRGDSGSRLRSKVRLVRALYERGWSRSDVLELFRLIDWMLRLPAELETGFRGWVAEFEAEKKMPYVTSVERLSREEGRVEMLQEAVLTNLEIQFQSVPENIRKAVSAIGEVERLRELQRLTLRVASLEAFERELLPTA
jgi:hypothetical protein